MVYSSRVDLFFKRRDRGGFLNLLRPLNVLSSVYFFACLEKES